MIKNTIFYFLFSLIVFSSVLHAQTLDKTKVLNSMIKVNDYWITLNPDYGDNRWYRAVYYIGNMAMSNTTSDPKYLNYSLGWAIQNSWDLNGAANTTFADNHTAGQVYIDLYNLDKQNYKIAATRTSIDYMLTTPETNNWYWIDALFMAMPVFAKFGIMNNDNAYFTKMHKLYLDTKNTSKLYNTTDGLWYRDANFLPPFKTKGGKDSYWSRGNGWVYGALVGVLKELPLSHPNRAEYISMFKKMTTTLATLQRSDGFWNTSLVDPTEFGGPETSGTALFTYGMAWGINNGILDKATYKPLAEKAWNGMVATAVHANGRLGYVQGRADRPGATSYDATQDYGVGAFLLSGSEMYILESETVSGQLPYTIIKNIPGVIEAENYDKGGNGIAYYDTTTGNTGSVYRIDDVDIGTNSLGYSITNSSLGEWLEYTVNVVTSGIYDMKITYSSGITGAKIGASFPDEGAILFSNFDLEQTIGYYAGSETKIKTGISLTSGKHVLRISVDQRGFNLDKFEFVASSLSTNSFVTGDKAKFTVFPNPNPAGIFTLSKTHLWKVYNLAGLELLKGEGNVINLSNFAKGIYLLKIGNLTKRIIIN